MIKKLLLSSLAALSLLASTQAQSTDFLRTASAATDTHRAGARALMAPFYHGVASGDPLTDRVMLWTRITSDSATVLVDWRIATDTAMTNIVQSGTFTTDASRDYTVKVDATGLQANTFYYYEFEAHGQLSIRGRTRTLPTGDCDSLRFAVVSCSNYAGGFYNAYDHISTRNDIDAVLHLGDYIYEYGDGEFGSARTLLPATEILSLSDYRTRHSHYKLDDDLIRLHQQYPFITVWDDHETANNAWNGGAGNHDPATEGDWLTRKSAGIQAYHEWMPIRIPDPADPERIHRKFQFGDLLDLYMMDTRLYGREEQDGINTDPNRTLLGSTQFAWLTNNLRTSPRRWQMLGQQVMMAPVNIPQPTFPITFPIANAPFLDDQWDGYSAERGKIYDTLFTYNRTNFVVLTGDIHSSWANDLPQAGYNSTSGAGSAGVEFVVTSVTSQNFPFPVSQSIIQNLNGHIKYADLTSHGYMIVDVNKQRTQSDWVNVSTISQQTYTTSNAASWRCNNGETFLRSSAAPATANPNRYPILAPLEPRDRSIGTSEVNSDGMESVLLGAYPNPVSRQLTTQFALHESAEVSLQLIDLSGRIVLSEQLGRVSAGIHRTSLQVESLPAGMYILSVRLGNKLQQRQIIKH